MYNVYYNDRRINIEVPDSKRDRAREEKPFTTIEMNELKGFLDRHERIIFEKK